MPNLKITTIDTTLQYSPKTSSSKEYILGGKSIARSSTFLGNGVYTSGRRQYTFDWNHQNLEIIFGDTYRENLNLLELPPLNLVYGNGRRKSLKEIKEIITKLHSHNIVTA